jgi:hypothetical protein
MIASLLPGLRDLRAPLAAGYLLLMAAYIWLAPRLPETADSATGLIADVYAVARLVGVAVSLAAASFVAYMLGIVSIGILSPVLNRVLAYLISAAVIAAWLSGAILSFLVVTALRATRRTERAESFQESTLFYFRRLERVIEPPLGNEAAATRLVTNTACNAYRTDSVVQETIRTAMTKKRIDAAIRHIIRPQPPTGRLWEDGEAMFVRDWTKAAVEQARRRQSQNDKTASSSLADDPQFMRAFARMALQNPAFLRAVLTEMANIPAHAGIVRNELSDIPARLITVSPESYERWDRLSAEAEFRKALIPGLAACCAALIARDSHAGWVVCGGIAACYFLWASSRSREKMAVVQLEQCIAAGIVTSHELDRVRAGDLYWREEPMRAFSDPPPGSREEQPCDREGRPKPQS